MRATNHRPATFNHRIVLAILTVGLAGCSGGAPETDSPRTHPSIERGGATVETPAAAGLFTPSRHGFRFRNSFTGDPLPAPFRDSAVGGWVHRNAPRVGLDVPDEFGLCGGMCAAVADFWLSGVLPPEATEPPPESDPLHTYLRERNADSMGATGVMALKFIEWMGLPDTPESLGGPSTGGRTVEQVKVIVQHVERTGYAHVGLVLVDSKSGKPWQNHQVLACGVLRSDDARVELRVYDPNYPGRDDIKVVAEFGSDQGGNAIARSRMWIGDRERGVRGFFLMPYEPRTPPEAVGGPRRSRT